MHGMGEQSMTTLTPSALAAGLNPGESSRDSARATISSGGVESRHAAANAQGRNDRQNDAARQRDSVNPDTDRLCASRSSVRPARYSLHSCAGWKRPLVDTAPRLCIEASVGATPFGRKSMVSLAALAATQPVITTLPPHHGPERYVGLCRRDEIPASAENLCAAATRWRIAPAEVRVKVLPDGALFYQHESDRSSPAKQQSRRKVALRSCWLYFPHGKPARHRLASNVWPDSPLAREATEPVVGNPFPADFGAGSSHPAGILDSCPPGVSDLSV